MTSDTTDAPIVVVGAGVVGVMTARALAKRGRRVTLVDRLSGPAEFTSRANAGIIAVGHAAPWAGPSVFGPLLRGAIGRNPGLRLTRMTDPALIPWGLAFLRQCTPAANRANKDALRRLARFSRDLLPPAEADMGLPPDTRTAGGLYLYSDPWAFRRAASHEPAMEALDPPALLTREPALANIAGTLAGGLYSAIDASGDCRLFTTRTAEHLSRSNTVELVFDRTITGFTQGPGGIAAVETDQGPIPCAAVVLATGVETPDLCAPLGFSPRIYPIKGYSGTWTIRDPERIPKLPFVDESAFVAVANYGDRLRVTTLAEFNGRDRTLPPQRTAILDAYVRRAFGDAVDLETPEYWTGLRPATPGALPYLGRVKAVPNLWLNAGHGQLGWTLSLGSAEILAQHVCGETPTLTGVSTNAHWLDAA